jgi:hypothetical protein
MEPTATSKNPRKVRAGQASQSPEQWALNIVRSFQDLDEDRQYAIKAIRRPVTRGPKTS